jgi:septal ring factor EnvC (AmiA/AmiB activator)
MSASEAVERNVRNAHDKHQLLNEMKQLEANLLLHSKEIQRQKEDLHLERQKHKATYLEKLSAERKVSELLVSKSRLEVINLC